MAVSAVADKHSDTVNMGWQAMIRATKLYRIAAILGRNGKLTNYLLSKLYLVRMPKSKRKGMGARRQPPNAESDDELDENENEKQEVAVQPGRRQPRRRTVELPAEAAFKRPLWVHFVRYFGLIVIIVLNVSMVMANLEHHQKGEVIDVTKEIVCYLFLLLIDATMLFPIIFEINSAKVSLEGIVIGTTLWRKKYKWTDIVKFNRGPSYLKLALIKTQRCFYLINKKDVRDFDILAAIIESRAGKPGPETPAVTAETQAKTAVEAEIPAADTVKPKSETDKSNEPEVDSTT